MSVARGRVGHPFARPLLGPAGCFEGAVRAKKAYEVELSCDDDDDNDDADDDYQYWGPLSKGLRPHEHEARWLGKHTEGTFELN